jgi:pectate lyase
MGRASAAIWAPGTEAIPSPYRQLKRHGVLPDRASASLLLLMLVANAGACRDINIDRLQGVGDVADESVRLVVENGTCASDVFGAATVFGPTTGGGTAVSVTVTNLADFIAYAKRTEPTIVRVKGMIAVPPGSHPFQILVGSNKTIVGIDAKSGLVGGGLLIDGAQNVIVRNLVIAQPVGTNGITLSSATHVWIDHCELYSDTKHSAGYYGWLVDIKSGSNFITASWNWFHDHFNTIQVGDSDLNRRKDTAHLIVTLHHNLFQKTALGEPQVRSGMVHVFNNYYQDIVGYAIASLGSSQVAVEENAFENVTIPLTNGQKSSARWSTSQIEDLGNSYYPSFDDAVPDQTGVFTFMPSAAYPYLADSSSSVPVIVGACAGPNITQNATSANPSDRIVASDGVKLFGALQP